MTSEVLGNSSAELSIVNATIVVEGRDVVIPTVDGKPYRVEVVGQLGKRYSCGQEVIIPPTANGPIEAATQAQKILSGSFTGKDGVTFNLGCGTTVLCLKAGNTALPSCCDMPMTLTQPRKLASSD